MKEALETYGQAIFTHSRCDEARRLSAIAQALDISVPRWLSQLPEQTDRVCLDLGSGLGTVARLLAERHPCGRVVATDLDTGFLEHARLPETVTILRHDVTSDRFPARSFDLIHARWLFCHLRQRDEILSRVVEWLKPGGWLVIEDPDKYPLQSSPHERYQRVASAFSLSVEERIGTDLQWARTFPQPFIALGLTSVGAHASITTVGGGTPMSRFWRLSLEQLSGDLRATFGIGDDEFVDVYADLESPRFQDVGYASVAMWGQRPNPG